MGMAVIVLAFRLPRTRLKLMHHHIQMKIALLLASDVLSIKNNPVCVETRRSIRASTHSALCKRLLHLLLISVQIHLKLKRTTKCQL